MRCKILQPVMDRAIRSGWGDNVRTPVSYWDPSLLKFDLSSIDGALEEATLKVFIEGKSEFEVNVWAHFDDQWDESDDVSPVREARESVLIATAMVQAPDYVEFDVTGYVSEQRAEDGVMSLELNTSLGGWNYLRARESATPPQLIARSELAAPPVLTTLSISPKDVTLEEGETAQFQVAGADQYGVAAAVSPEWSVSAGGTITEDGLFTASHAGPYVVTASDGDVTATTTVTVTEIPVLDPPELQSLVMESVPRILLLGESHQLIAEGRDQYGDEFEIDPQWNITGGGEIDDSGVLSPTERGGPFSVTVTAGELVKEASFFVAEPVTITVEEVPTTSTANAAEASRFLMQATFGSNLNEINQLLSSENDFSAWIEQQSTLPATLHSSIPHGPYQNGRLQAWWRASIQAPDQLRQRTAFALSQIFVISDFPDLLRNNTEATFGYYDMLVENSFGNFRDVLESVTKHLSMGLYLSLKNSQQADEETGIRPDENYAREVMQLFTIGLNQLNQDGSFGVGRWRASTHLHATRCRRVITSFDWVEFWRSVALVQ